MNLRGLCQEILDMYVCVESCSDEIRIWRDFYLEEKMNSNELTDEQKICLRNHFLAIPTINFMIQTIEQNYEMCKKLAQEKG